MKTRIVEFSNGKNTYYKVQRTTFLGFWSNYLYKDGETGYGDTFVNINEAQDLNNKFNYKKKVYEDLKTKRLKKLKKINEKT